ncbi:MAG: siderophore-interacting protein [Gordonia sp. (in: high G+C Gram-positive bacteria)]
MDGSEIRNPQQQMSTARLFRVRVSGRRQLSENMVRISFTGDDLRHFVAAGPDQRVKLILSTDGRSAPALNPGMTPRDILAMPEDQRPVMRTYTIRSHRPEVGEVDIDFALHGDTTGPASRWAQVCAEGWEVAIFGPVSAYAPPSPSVTQLIAGDETALPAIGAIVEQLPAGTYADVLVEVATAGDKQQLSTAADVHIRWLIRDVKASASGELLAAAVESVAAQRTYEYAWVACESATAAAIRRHLVERVGLSKSSIYFSGYWRIGSAVG